MSEAHHTNATVFRCVPKRGGGYIIASREGRTAYSSHAFPPGAVIRIDAGRVASPVVADDQYDEPLPAPMLASRARRIIEDVAQRRGYTADQLLNPKSTVRAIAHARHEAAAALTASGRYSQAQVARTLGYVDSASVARAIRAHTRRTA